MVNKRIHIDLVDSRSEGNNYLANLLDPVRFGIFIERVQVKSGDKSVDELFLDLLEGK